jgi:2-dehydro-3-deoxyphosphogluconate aldolase / (4S)-4-hydroxy-2-oxoglutarate aldolase
LVSKDEVVRRVHEAGVISIFRVEAPQGCVAAMEALTKGGLSVFEVTMTTPGALDVVREARKKFGDGALVGAGTVLDRTDAEKAIEAGAQFLVSPSLDREVLQVCSEKRVVSCPGAFTATEIVQAWKWDADLVKVFPVSQVGPGYIRAIRAPLPQIRLVPTGGVDASNLGEYMAAGAFAVGIGGGLIPARSVAEGRYDKITEAAALVSGAVARARGGR